MRIGVTGATGIVGRFVLKAARAAGHEVVPLTRRPGEGGRPFDLEAPERTSLGDLDALIHAAFAHVPGRYRGGEGDDPDGFLRRNLDGSVRLFEAAAEAGVARVVFLSSRAVYGGYPAGTALDEEMPPRPDTLYGEAKVRAEAALAALAPRFTLAASLRATGVYGAPSAGEPHKWTDLFRDFRDGRPIPPRRGTELHGADLADAVLRLLGETGSGTWTASDLLLDRHDLLTEAARLTGWRTAPPPPSDAPVSEMSCTRLHALGWRPRGWAGLQEALPDLLVGL